MRPNSKPPAKARTVKERDKQQQRSFALIVGCIAFFLPVLLYLGPKVAYGCERYSLSHFYYSPFYGGIFIGLLAFIGTYLIAYRGDRKDETYAASFAGLCAFGVAFLPTGGHGCLNPDDNGFRARSFMQFSVDDTGAATLNLPTDDAGQATLQSEEFFTLLNKDLLFGHNFADLHYYSATGLFLVLLYFCFVVFQRKGSRHKQSGGALTTIKKVRNGIYYACGLVICLSMYKLGAAFLEGDAENSVNTAWNNARGTFRWEAYALMAFGFSWMVKGRFVPWLIDDSEKNKA